jgi:hypothetical protein
MYAEVSGPQNSNKDLTNSADKFEQTVNGMVYTVCEWDKTLCTEIKNVYGQYFYQLVSWENKWQPMTAPPPKKNVLAHLMLIGIVQKLSV